MGLGIEQLHAFDLGAGASMPWVRAGDPAGLPTVVVPGVSDGLLPVGHPGQLDFIGALPDPAEFGLPPLDMHIVSHRTPMPEATSIEDLAADLARFLAEVVRRPSLLVGHSLGAMVAMQVAARAPDRVRALVLTAVPLVAGPALAARLDRWDALLRAGDVHGHLADAAEASWVPDRDHAPAALPPAEVPAPELISRHLALSAAAREHDARAVVGSIVAPTLVCAADQDPLVPLEDARALAVEIHGSDFHVFHGLRHGFTEQDQSGMARRMAAFLTTTLGQRPMAT